MTRSERCCFADLFALFIMGVHLKIREKIEKILIVALIPLGLEHDLKPPKQKESVYATLTIAEQTVASQ